MEYTDQGICANIILGLIKVAHYLLGKAIDVVAKKAVLESSTWARAILVREAEKMNEPKGSP